MAFYDSLNLEKGMYNAHKKSFTQVLEEIDPSANYSGTSLEGLDAFERQLKRYNIKVSGKGSDVVEKFFQTSNSSVLFPEYITRAVNQGMDYVNVLPSLVATTTMIDGLDYRSIASIATDNEKELKPVLEGAYMPQTVVKTQNNLVKLNKRGRMLVSSYEALRFQKLDLFTVTLKQIGSFIARSQLADAVDVLLNGDGNNNAIGSVSGTHASLTYNSLVQTWAELEPYQLNTIIANTSMMQSILGLSELQDAAAGLNFHGTGQMITPLGATLIHAPTVSDNTIIGLDKNCALEMVQAGEVMTDYDKLIDRQLERATISCIAGFAKIFKDASIKYTITNS